MSRRIAHVLALVFSAITAVAGAGQWLEPRHNPQLTAIQPMPGDMRAAPAVVARYDLGRNRPAITAVILDDESASIGLAVVSGGIHAYDTNGGLLWQSHPPGLNFQQIQTVDDLDGDGVKEILVTAGRPTAPYGAVVLLALHSGEVRWRYDVEPISYAWYLYHGRYLPDAPAQQIVVIMHGYPPDEKNGYIALFTFPGQGGAPQQRWRYDFHEYTCFPSFLQTDLEGDGVEELVVETHSRIWFLDALSGEVKQFVKWDVSPANVRSYGYVGFADLNGDSREDFLCIATFAQHHEVLLNRDGRFEKAWHYGWPESVTTGKVDTVHPEPPYADVDGDGHLEVVVSIFNGENDQAWCTRVYDAETGEIEQRIPGAAAVTLHDVDDDGAADILANVAQDAAQAVQRGARLYAIRDGAMAVLWENTEATAIQKDQHTSVVRTADGVFTLAWKNPGIHLESWAKQPKPVKELFASVPAVVGPPPPTLLAADLFEGAGSELLLYAEPAVTILQLVDGHLLQKAAYTSSSVPVIADLNGDGQSDLVLSTIEPAAPPIVRATTPAHEDRLVWESQFPPAGRAGLPQPRTAYIRTVHLTGKPTPDLYVWAGTPVVRSAGLDGQTGNILWEKGEVPHAERYWGASVNYASAFDHNGDGQEDLVFTNPDYYCVADGPTGDFLVGPSFPPDIFSQSCQGLYTYPAILTRSGEEPLAALVAGHYFQAVMTINTKPLWYRIPVPGDNRAGAEAFLQLPDGVWLMGFGRQNGNFACVDVATGAVRWEWPVEATCSDVIAGDLDGDGQVEFLFGTSHGQLIALGDDNAKPRLLWKSELPAGVGAPILADFDGDDKAEIAVPTTDGYIQMLDTASKNLARSFHGSPNRWHTACSHPR